MGSFESINPDTAQLLLTVPGDWRRREVREAYKILWNQARAYGQIWPRPTAQDVAAYYDFDDYYTHETSAASTEPGVPFGQRVMTKLAWLADKGVEPDRSWWAGALNRNNMRILEIGCGSGANIALFKSLGHEAIGVEPDARALEVARAAGHQAYQGTAESLPPEVMQDRFDAVVFLHVLEHCIDPFRAVQNATQLLKPGGLIVVEVPNNECGGRERFGPFWYWLDIPRHLNFFTDKSLTDLIRSVGFKVEDRCFCGYCRQFSPAWKEAQNEIAHAFGMQDDRRIKPLSYWAFLFETAFAKAVRKYDSVRMVGRFAED